MEFPPLSKSFRVLPHTRQWVHWNEMEACFWPGQGKRACNVDAHLAEARLVGGIYLLRWGRRQTEPITHEDPSIIYIGETSCFVRRMGDWGNSAGFWGERGDGHYAGWRWDQGNAKLWVAFFEAGSQLRKRLGKHVRTYYESRAIEEYRVANGRLPEANEWEKVSED